MFNGMGFCSVAEAACAIMLELYVPDFKVQEGVTYQIAMHNGGSVDFAISGVLFEYHHLRSYRDRRRFGDFKDRQSYEAFQRQFCRVRNNPYKREKLIAQTRRELRESYINRRRQMIDANPIHRGRELIVATSVEELYENVIRRFNPHFSPNRDEFLELYERLVRTIARENHHNFKNRKAA
jgi:hypothetical protein